MNWYIAKIIFNINIDNGKDTSQFDEQYRIIQAFNEDEAFYKARTIGKKEEDYFINENNVPIRWQFIDVAELHALQDLKDGQEVYSTTYEKQNANEFIQFVREKSMAIQVKNLTFA